MEVDNNVTRHLDSELDNTEWDVLILHYLGLDHIGHYQGPSRLSISISNVKLISPLMKPKQEEMDRIIERMWKKIIQQDSKYFYDYSDTQRNRTDTLFVVAGDHGMTEVVFNPSFLL